ncbi:multifunctional nucleotidyltransferase/glutamate rich protein GrpB/ribosomal protein alanine acetyltransferase [Legionella birminghamensis]|uniref:Multifunctional nucleotidyltransferase/glutamate rich protein GrpB/ribosomal protein alanine acetyltransferase n=1 Tax=Legionella birminghamensis TaxID=28083 RepID=A0A378IE83_9GAMM|nr:GNAT family N-acetyltransferase [Legionella birminghamensis]KTC72559.1 multifunctional nucleotidyltransferase/glutamate rich protein GrpB/ribosomal protein alanine acetyltransferase [Legionella birminghamensis]STX32831.1 Ribosomal-protein-S5p-alanine acetyltransferase [Legionella birminghamensis]
MEDIIIREPEIEDKQSFLQAMQHSQSFHYPWVTPPLTAKEYDDFFLRTLKSNQKSFFVCNRSNDLLGVFNITEIVRGLFQNAYLGFYSVADYTGKGYMSVGLKLVLHQVFNELKLHRLEANIQPDNRRSIQLVKNNGFRYEGFSPRYLKINNEWRGHEHWAITVEDYIAESPEILKKDHVTLEPYNPEWPSLAQREIDKIKSVFPEHSIIDIQHIGSTAIAGLSAKPILDIQIAVPSLESTKLIAVPILQKLGYEYWADNPDPGRMFFVKGMPPYGEKRTHHVHIVEQNSAHWRNKLLFRDYLRLHPDVASEYEQLKFKLAQEHLYDREKYTDEKLSFVSKVLQLAQR